MNNKIEYIDVFTEVFYEKKNRHLIKFEKIHNTKKNNKKCCDNISCVCVKIYYPDSELTTKIRNEFSFSTKHNSLFGVDNILKCINGYCSLLYPLDKSKILK